MESLPHAFKDQIQHQLHGEFPAFIDALQTLSPTSIRLHPKKDNNRSIQVPVPWTAFGAYLDERPVFTLDPKFHGGSYYVQEASSMFLEQAIKQSVDLTQSLKVLDLCAAPGGKSTHLLSLLNDRSLLVSNEVIRSRASILSENIQKWGYPNCLITNNDPKDFSTLAGFFDVIVVDAPCSGEGLFRKDPQAVNQWSTENVTLCAARQKRILHDVWPALKEDGVLIYCTCTYNEKENEENLIALKNKHHVEFIDLMPSPSWNIQTIEKDNIIGYRFFPHHIKGEGFFLSAFRKKETADSMHGKIKSKLTTPTKKITERLRDYITDSAAYNFFQHNDLTFLLPENHVSNIETLLQNLRFIYGGTNLATVKHDKLIPEHALALSTALNRSAFPCIDVDEKTAIQYLRREAISLPDSAIGFSLLTFQDIPIGWANVLQNRVNNMYPQEWRIRMAVS
jgi:16S rRNA C967 or C1407 C5-methylase (RsmB/RsmF family)/NOL1/NOP2/fmu family ribosome biogenesis protein